MNAPTNTAESTALATLDTRAPTGRDLILHADNLNAMVRVSELMAKSQKMVPGHLRNNPGGCLALTMQAMRWNMDPFALAQKTFEVNDLVGYEAQAIISALNNSPLLATRLKWKWEGDWSRIVGKFKQVESKTKKDDNGNPKKYIVPAWDFDKDEEGLMVTVSATLVGESEPAELTLLMKQARTRNSPLWVEDPKQQLAYLAAKRWGRLYAPDVIMGVYTPDELEQVGERFMGPADVVGAPPPAPPAPPATYSQSDFEKNIPAWTDVISKGRKTPDALIAMVESKGPKFTDAQKAALRAIKGPTDATPKTTTPPVEDGPKFTYAELADQIVKATGPEGLDSIKDLARHLPEDQQTGLATLVKDRAREIGLTS